MPMGGSAERWATPMEIQHIRGLYAGEAAFVDNCLGRLFAAFKDLGCYDDAVIVVMADHGHPLADHGKFLNSADRMYSAQIKVPFMIRLPGGQRARCSHTIVQFHNVLPTLLDLLGWADNASSMHGRSFLPVLRGAVDTHREVMITGYHESLEGCTRDQTWSCMLRPEGQPDELYNLDSDPLERHNLIDQYPDESRSLAGAFGSYFLYRAAQSAVKGLLDEYQLGIFGGRVILGEPDKSF